VTYFDYRWASAQIGGWRDDEVDQSIRAQTAGDPPFYGVVMLAMQRADSFNLARLIAAWPEVYSELDDRYNAPGAILPSDPEPLKQVVATSLGTTVEALSR